MKTFLVDSLHLIYTDIKQYKIPVAVVLAYLMGSEILFHSICPFVILFHFPCPACGLTRAGINVFCGHFLRAWQLNPTIYLWMLLILSFIIKRYFLKKQIKKALLWSSSIAVLTIILYIYRLYAHTLPPV